MGHPPGRLGVRKLWLGATTASLVADILRIPHLAHEHVFTRFRLVAHLVVDGQDRRVQGVVVGHNPASPALASITSRQYLERQPKIPAAVLAPHPGGGVIS
jgi:hypothetical protein